MQEEFGTLDYIIKKNLQYLLGDKRRILLAGVYVLYLFIFGRRVVSLLVYFKDLLLKNLQRLGLGKTPAAKGPELSLFKRILVRIIKGLYFVYSLVIGS